MAMTNEIERMSPRAMELMRGIAQIAKSKKEIEAKDAAMRDELLALCEEYGVEKIDNEYVRISRVAGSESVSIDLKKLQAEEGQLYDDLLADYPKKTVRKAYIRITAKA